MMNSMHQHSTNQDQAWSPSEVTLPGGLQYLQSSPPGSLLNGSPNSFQDFGENELFQENYSIFMEPFRLDGEPQDDVNFDDAEETEDGHSHLDNADEEATLDETYILPDHDIPEGTPVYNYQRDASDRLDSSSLLRIKMALSPTAKKAVDAATSIHSVVKGKLLRFDGAQIPYYDKTEAQMKILRVPDAVFSYEVDGRTLVVDVHRKYLPISKNFGDIPFRFAFYFPASEEVVSTNSFEILSKEPSREEKLKAQQRKPPRRKRGPSPKEPLAVAATEEDNIVSQRLREVAGWSSESRIAHVARKRARTEPNSGDRRSVAESTSTAESAYDEETGSVIFG